jgi:hypothetical protein
MHVRGDADDAHVIREQDAVCVRVGTLNGILGVGARLQGSTDSFKHHMTFDSFLNSASLTGLEIARGGTHNMRYYSCQMPG